MEEIEQILKILTWETSVNLIERITLKESSIEIWYFHFVTFRQSHMSIKEVIICRSVRIQSTSKKRFKDTIQEVRLLLLSSIFIKVQHKLRISLTPLFASRHTQPAFLL